MSLAIEFGDFDPDDAYDTEPADPEQVSIKLHGLRVAIDDLVGEAGLPQWDDLTPEEQTLGLAVGGVIVDWIRTHSPDDPTEVARHLHNVRRYWASSRLPPWEELPDDDRQVGVLLMTLLIEWLARQGALG